MSFVEMSLSGGLIILAAVLLRAAARDRLPIGTFTALWTLAAARLVLPVRLPFRLSLFTLIRRAVPHAAAPGSTLAVAVPGLSPEAVDIIHDIPAPAAGAPFPTLTVLWLAGAGLCAAGFLLSYIRAYRRFRDGEAVSNDYVNQFLAKYPLRRWTAVRVSDRVDAPLTYGLIRPVILLPRAMDLADSETLGYVLAHELAHIRRFDAARKLALAGVACLHWFDPLVWVMLVLAGRDMERACDRAVVRAFGADARHGYARALLDLEARRARYAPSSGFAGNAIEERIHSIMKIRPTSFLSAALALALVLGVGAVFATAAPEDETAADALTGDVITSSDGTVYVFTDDGKPVSVTQQEYKTLFPSAEVEWWTAEEYAAWLEQEKKDLQDCLGQRVWTNTEGWFTWTQEKIDETIEMYEQMLEEIENGLLVSKTVDGQDDVVLMQGDGNDWDELYDDSENGVIMYRRDDGDTGWTYHMMTEAEASAMEEQNEATAEERRQLEQQLAQLDQERAEIEQKLAAMGEAKAQIELEADGTIAVPPSETVTAFFKQTDGDPYGEIESGSRVRLSGDVHATAGNTVAVSLITRTDASITVSLHGDITTMGKSVDLKADQIQTVTFRPEQDDTFVIYLTNNSEYPVEFIASQLVT